MLALLVLGQGAGGFKPPKPKAPPKASAAPVTRAEARAVFVRLAKTADRAIPRKGARAAYSPAVGASGDLTSADVRAELGRLTDRYAPDFRLVPVAVSGLTGERRVKALRMWSPNGPISLSKPTLTVAQFGDAVGYFLVRLGDLTHTPSHRYSPATMPDGS